GVAVVYAGGDGGRSAVAGADAACAAGAGGAGAGVRAPVGAGWLRPAHVAVGEPAVGDSGGAVGGPDRPVALHVGGAGGVVLSHPRRGGGAAGGGRVWGGGGRARPAGCGAAGPGVAR